MELIIYEPVVVINTDEIDVGDSITFDYDGIQANGYVSDINEDGFWMKVKYWNHVKQVNGEVQLDAESITQSNFDMLKWADYGFLNIEDRISMATKEAYLASINVNEIFPGTAFYYSLDGVDFTMGLANKVDKTYIDLILKDKKVYRLTLDAILTEPFECRFSDDLDQINYYPARPDKFLLQPLKTSNDELFVLKKGNVM